MLRAVGQKDISRRFLFFWRGGVVFLQGYCENSAADYGILMVSLWWIGGKRWSLSDHLFLAENFPLFELYFD
jgi:hypothetical protein